MVKVAVVTGANRGIGLATVTFLCRKFKGDVILCSRDLKRGQQAVDELKAKGLNPYLHHLDIDDKESIEILRDFLVGKYNGLDVLVNNAARAYPNASTVPFLEQAVNTLNTNYFALVNVCNVLFPILKPHARVVNVSSSLGMLNRVVGEDKRRRLSDPNLTLEGLNDIVREFLDDVKNNTYIERGWPKNSYAMSKVAVTALTFIQQRQFDTDPRPDLVVNAVHPGYVATGMSNFKGVKTPEEGAIAPSYCALLPPNVTQPKGSMIWHDRKIVDCNAQDYSEI